MDIHQVSATYLQEQDRILVRINTQHGEEMRLWFTRRLVLGLWPSLNRAVAHAAEFATRAASGPGTQHNPDAQRMLGEFQRDAALQKADFKTPYKALATPSLPLGDEPLLVTEVRITPKTTGALQIEFIEKLSNGQPPRGFQVELVGTLIHGLMHLLEQALGHSQWRKAPQGAADAETEPARAEGDGRPRYLN
jgi:hypothetical protein